MPADSLLDGTTLSKTEVTTLQQAVNVFAAAYTSGANATADQAAAAALQESLTALAATLVPTTSTNTAAATTTTTTATGTA